ncbi:MAG: molybdopterin-dependent oxidoreductase, partial [Ferrovibrionaceae bacterium]
VKDGWNGFNVLHDAAARVGGLEIGFVPGEGGRDVAGILDGARSGAVKLVYLLGADEIDTAGLGEAFVVYQGSHGDKGAHRADVVLPGAAYTEKDAIWVNLEGRVQLGRRAAPPPGEAREDWAIIRALSGAVGQVLPYDDQRSLRRRILEIAPHLAAVDQVTPAAWAPFGTAGQVAATPFTPRFADFWLTNPIARASATMAKLSAMFGKKGEEKATGTHG